MTRKDTLTTLEAEMNKLVAKAVGDMRDIHGGLLGRRDHKHLQIRSEFIYYIGGSRDL